MAAYRGSNRRTWPTNTDSNVLGPIPDLLGLGHRPGEGLLDRNCLPLIDRRQGDVPVLVLRATHGHALKLPT